MFQRRSAVHVSASTRTARRRFFFFPFGESPGMRDRGDGWLRHVSKLLFARRTHSLQLDHLQEALKCVSSNPTEGGGAYNANAMSAPTFVPIFNSDFLAGSICMDTSPPAAPPARMRKHTQREMRVMSRQGEANNMDAECGSERASVSPGGVQRVFVGPEASGSAFPACPPLRSSCSDFAPRARAFPRRNDGKNDMLRGEGGGQLKTDGESWWVALREDRRGMNFRMLRNPGHAAVPTREDKGAGGAGTRAYLGVRGTWLAESRGMRLLGERGVGAVSRRAVHVSKSCAPSLGHR